MLQPKRKYRIWEVPGKSFRYGEEGKDPQDMPLAIERWGIIEFPPQKRTARFNTKASQLYFLQFPWKYLCYRYRKVVYPDSLTTYSCRELAAYSTLDRLEPGHFLTSAGYLMPGVDGDLCPGNTNIFRREFRSFDQLLREVLDFYWLATFYSPGSVFLDKWQKATWSDFKEFLFNNFCQGGYVKPKDSQVDPAFVRCDFMADLLRRPARAAFEQKEIEESVWP
jgi:hypothetical protein